MNSNNNIQNSGIVNANKGLNNVGNSTNSYKDGFDGDIQKAKEYNQQVGTQGVGSMTSSSSSSMQNSFEHGLGGDIQKAKQYNQQVGAQGVGNMNSSAGSSNGSMQ